MKQTAVDWLFEKMDVIGFSEIPTSVTASKEVWKEIYKEAKEMEKEQIKESYDAGVWEVGCRNADSDEYYKETYGTDG